MKHSLPNNHDRSTPPQGSVLLMVLVAITIMSLTAGTYLVLMHNEHMATRYRGRREQARLLAESGVEYLQAFLDQSDSEIQEQGGLYDNSDAMQSILVIENTSPAYRGFFTILAAKLEDGYYSDLRYGMENESAKLNLNVLIEDDDPEDDTARKRLLAIPGIDSKIADAILDWLDEDDEDREFGAEQSYYQDLPVEYEPRNGHFTGLDELLMIKGITAELLYGLDADRSYVVESQEEQPRGALEELDNNEGQLNRGLSAYLTVYSMEKLSNPEGKPRIDVNDTDLQKLHDELSEAVGEEEAKFIILYRQNGAADDKAVGNSTSLNAAEIDFEKETQTEIATLLDLVGASVAVKKEKDENNAEAQNEPAQIFGSPWQEDSENFREDFLALLDLVQVGSENRIAGRVNINAASKPVLLSIPEMTETAADQILTQRDSEVDLEESVQRHPYWILAEGIVDKQQMRKMEPYITTRGDVYSAQVVGYFETTTPRSRGEVVFDRTGETTQLLNWLDLSKLGPGVARRQLGEEPEGQDYSD
ncbi:MAG: general secretion pathway protein GspK [Planctomycetes bacterium]|nr:general secretion pathway protein GspK [Planctomycetota bacterium]